MVKTTGKAEHFIEVNSGCGPFQVIILVVVVFTTISTLSYSIVFMSFGNYNPGWRCMDNITSLNTSTAVEDISTLGYTTGSCDVYNECKNVEFNPETSTIVTEWGLLCDKAWMSSFTISIQMAGMLFFSFLVGQVADMLGRKKTLYGSLAVCGCLQLISAFSVSWSMFVVLLFLICGLSTANLVVALLYVSEFMTIRWRAIIVALPFWYTGTTIQAVAALITKNWRHLQFVGFVLHVLCVVPVFWVPESLRWLEVKRMWEEFNVVAQKINKLNKAGELPVIDNSESVELDLAKELKLENGVVKKYTIIDIFRHGYALISVCVGFMTMLFSVTVFSMVFGTKVLYGDFYINLILTNVISIVIFLAAIPGINYMSRRRFTFLMLVFSAICVAVATGLLFSDSDAAKTIGSTMLIAVARATVDSTWFCTYSRVAEVYPTVVRGIAVGYVSLTARAGGIMAPFIIPEDTEHLYIFTIITGGLILLACILNLALPETKGKPLKEDFES